MSSENPLGVDPRVGVHDLCYDNAKPGAKLYVVERLADSAEQYQAQNPDAPRLDEYEGNVVTGMSPTDAVFACVYASDSLTKCDFTAYPMPESRLTRFPAEEATLIGESSSEFTRSPLGSDSSEETDTDTAEDGHRLTAAEPDTPPATGTDELGDFEP